MAVTAADLFPAKSQAITAIDLVAVLMGIVPPEASIVPDPQFAGAVTAPPGIAA